MTTATIALTELAEKGADIDVLRQMVQFMAQWLMELDVEVNRTPFGGRHEATMSVIHGRPVRSLATNREPAVGG